MRLGRCPSLRMGLCAFRHCDNQKGKDSTLDKQRWGGRRHFVRNQHKNSVFRIFLMQTYGMNYLNRQDCTIIDAAGGKGELAWELINLTGVKECVVVDPRPLSLSLVQSKWKKGLFEPKRTGPVFSKWYPACEDGCKLRLSESPKHMRCFLDGKETIDFMNASSGEAADVWYQSQLDRARKISWTSKGLTVGLHCDQAAGEIVEFASALNIPWCIVPCCVYSEIFSCRKLRNGTRVKTYEHLVQWLCERDDRAKVATLDIEGKNKVVYTLP
ncbi:hypothetical protein ACHAWC_009348 [Mediolabrus comicus]